MLDLLAQKLQDFSRFVIWLWGQEPWGPAIIVVASFIVFFIIFALAFYLERLDRERVYPRQRWYNPGPSQSSSSSSYSDWPT